MTTILLSNFSGINNKANENRLPDGYLRECVDFDVSANGMLLQRGGYALRDDAVYSCIGGDDRRCFAVRNGDLVEVMNDYSFVTLRVNVGYINLSFVECNGDYFYVGDTINGVIAKSGHKSFGQQRVEQQPTLSAIDGGALLAGTYLVAITTLDADGMESGTVAPAVIVVDGDNKAVQLTGLFVPTDPRCTHLAIYMSDRNGSELYRQGVIYVGIPTVSIFNVDISGFALNSIGISPAPCGQLIAYHYGHLFIANNNYLFYSEPYQYERWNAVNNYTYESSITAIMPMESGLWIGTEKHGLFWINGKTPSHGIKSNGDFTQTKKHTVCLARNSEQWISRQGFEGWMVTTEEGIFLLQESGQYTNVTQANIKIPVFSACASALIDEPDCFKYLAIIKGAKVPLLTI